ncbi:MAG: BON domain-containing protein [Deltaproteobacteria bacterium]|nr:BON domain-containing protein [Deltaproteobacteria bacterium]
MKKCSKCLKEFESQFTFCPQCGGLLTDYEGVRENEAAVKDGEVQLEGKIEPPRETGTAPEPSVIGAYTKMLRRRYLPLISAAVALIFSIPFGFSGLLLAGMASFAFGFLLSNSVSTLLLKNGRKLPVIPFPVAMGVSIYFVVLAIFFHFIITWPHKTAQNSSSLGAATPKIGPQAVWNPPGGEETWRDIHEKCQMRSGGYDISCIESMMQKLGASAEAIGFTKMMKLQQKSDSDAVYLRQFRKMGKVDLAETVGPTRDSPIGPGFILVNGSPGVVHLWENAKNIDITKDSLYRTIAKKFPKLEMWPRTGFIGMLPLQPEGQSFVFSFLLLDGCRSCDIAGAAEIAFDFDGSGKFIGAKLVRLVERVAAITSQSLTEQVKAEPVKPGEPANKGIPSGPAAEPVKTDPVKSGDTVAGSIEQAFISNAINGLNILKTQEGVYKISGTVKDSQEADRIVWIASSVPGVKRVDPDFKFPGNRTSTASQVPSPVSNVAAPVASSVPAPVPTMKGRIESELANRGFPGLIAWVAGNGSVRISGTDKYPGQTEVILSVASTVSGSADVQVLNLPPQEQDPKPQKRNPDKGWGPKRHPDHGWGGKQKPDTGWGAIARPSRD